MSKSNKSTKARSGNEEKPAFHFVFGKKNYMLMILGIVVMIIGFALMSGTEDIYSDMKIKVAPVVVIAGFVIEGFAILIRPKEDESN